MLTINKLFKYSVSTEAPCESSSWKETPKEIVRYPLGGGGGKEKADLNNYAMWKNSDLF